jgi:hypothetical protein
LPSLAARVRDGDCGLTQQEQQQQQQQEQQRRMKKESRGEKKT